MKLTIVLNCHRLALTIHPTQKLLCDVFGTELDTKGPKARKTVSHVQECKKKKL